MKNKTKETQCSFCHKPKSEATLLISGIDGYICETCIMQAQTILNEEMGLESEQENAPKKVAKKTSEKAYRIEPSQLIKNCSSRWTWSVL
jgi:ATP-dependent Clp protease ATP-binding subunit ClpX